MDREHIKGAADKVKGAVKDTAGKVTGDNKMQAGGRWTGRRVAHNAISDAKDAARDSLNCETYKKGRTLSGRPSC
jgi:uncharacterized protein YjbJ (UPF0337 family)